MSKHLVFFHKAYAVHFGPIIRFLLRHYDVRISFFSELVKQPLDLGVEHYLVKPDESHVSTPYFFSRYFEQECRALSGVWDAFHQARLDSPDVFIGHVLFGNLLFLHAAYPEIPRIGFFEIFIDPFQHTERFRDKQYPVPRENILRLPYRNALQLLELEYCSKGYSPTPYQRSTYPQAYQHKLAVHFDGIDTDVYRPGPVSAQSPLVKTWPSDAKLVTYAARGLEAFRGFDVFMEAAYRICQRRDDVHFLIAGSPETIYGSEMMALREHGFASFKDYVVRQRPYDLSRFHFLGFIPEAALGDLYRLSDCHVYWTVPHTLSWSFFQALSTGVPLVGSNTAPLQEVIVDGENGMLVEPYDVEGFVEQILAALEHPNRYIAMRQAARETVVQRYSVEACMPGLAEFYLAQDTSHANTNRPFEQTNPI